MPTFTKLKGITDISEAMLSDQLEANIIQFFNWGLLGVGAFFNVTLDQTESGLRLAEDEDFEQGRVWRPFRSDIVWESGVEYGLQPIAISGVYVNDAFIPADNTGQYEHYVDYANGRVVFTNPLTIDDEVKMEYSYRYFHFDNANTPWFKQIMFESFNVDQAVFHQQGSGVFSLLGQNNIQLPAVVVEIVPRRNLTGYQLGGGQRVRQDVCFHVFTENPWDRKTIIDVISFQNQKTIRGFDKNIMAQQGAFALDETGALVDSPIMYPDLVDIDSDFYWKNILLDGVSSQEVIAVPPLCRAVIRGTYEIILGEI